MIFYCFEEKQKKNFPFRVALAKEKQKENLVVHVQRRERPLQVPNTCGVPK